MANNRRLFMPKARPPKEEVELAARREIWVKGIEAFIKEECDPKGRQRSSSLNSQQSRGLKKLAKRGKIFGLGEDHGEMNARRAWDNVEGEACHVPIMKVLPKIHKARLPNGDPKTRPVVGAASGLTARAGDLVADLLDSLTKARVPAEELLSTEEVLHNLENAAAKIAKEGERIVPGSADVEALYPNIETELTAEECGKEMEESMVEVKGVDYRAAVVYLAACLSREEVAKQGLLRVIPIRRSRRGARPGVTTKELTTRKQIKVKVRLTSDDAGHEEGCGDDGQEEEGVSFQGPETKWSWSPEPMEFEKRRILGQVVRCAVRNIMRDHHYQFAGKVYKQARGGGIGLRLTGSAASVRMDRRARTIKPIMEENMIKTHVFGKYVDDVNWVLESVGLGTRWDNEKGRLRWDQDWEEEDRRLGTSEDKVTMQAMLGMANSVAPDLKFTVECADDHEGGRIPMLDLMVWREQGADGSEKLLHCYYEKPVTSQKVMIKGLAMPMATKMEVLAQEVIRRMRNTSLLVPLEVRRKVLDQAMQKMCNSGYTEGERKAVLEAGVKGYCNKVAREHSQGRRVNRSREEGKEDREAKRLTGAGSWFRKERSSIDVGKETKVGPGSKARRSGDGRTGRGKAPGRREKGRSKEPMAMGKLLRRGEKDGQGGDDPRPKVNRPSHQPRTESVLFIPHTEGSKLRKALQAAEDKYARLNGTDKVRMVERGGRKIMQLLVRSDPWAGEPCGRQDCLPCTTGEEGRTGICTKEGILYKLSCTLCRDLDVKAWYLGESSRCKYIRGREHLAGVAARDPKHPLVKHHMEAHGEDTGAPQFKMDILRQFLSTLPRQIAKAVIIELARCHIILYSKSEWNGPRLPCITVELGAKVVQEDFRGSSQESRPLGGPNWELSGGRGKAKNLQPVMRDTLRSPSRERLITSDPPRKRRRSCKEPAPHAIKGNKSKDIRKWLVEPEPRSEPCTMNEDKGETYQASPGDVSRGEGEEGAGGKEPGVDRSRPESRQGAREEDRPEVLKEPEDPTVKDSGAGAGAKAEVRADQTMEGPGAGAEAAEAAGPRAGHGAGILSLSSLKQAGDKVKKVRGGAKVRKGRDKGLEARQGKISGWVGRTKGSAGSLEPGGGAGNLQPPGDGQDDLT